MSTTASDDLIGAPTVPQAFEGIAARIEGPRAREAHSVLSWVMTDLGTT